MKLPTELVALLDGIVTVRDGKRIEDLNEKFLSVSSEVLGDEYLADGHVIVWNRSQVTFEDCERILENLDEELALQLWDAATTGALTREA